MNQNFRPPSLILGTMTFGTQVDEVSADRMIGLFLDAGHREIDTAYCYGKGGSEEILGRVITPARRQQIFLATKANPWEEGGLCPASVRLQLETSLRRLQTESVDLFYLHAPDLKTPIESTLAACQELYREGKFRALGLSNYASWQVVDIWHICQRNNWVLPTVYQGRYNAITRDVEPELFPALRAMGMRFCAFNLLAGGMLTGKHVAQEQYPTEGRFALMSTYRDRFWNKSYFEAVDHLRSLCEESQICMVESALRWALFHSHLSALCRDALIVGASCPEQLTTDLKSASRTFLPEEILRAYEHAWEVARSDSPRYFYTKQN